MGKTWNYIKTWFGKKTEDIKDPEIELEQAIQEAQKRDQELRNQAAQVSPTAPTSRAELEEASGDVAEAKELAKQALLGPMPRPRPATPPRPTSGTPRRRRSP